MKMRMFIALDAGGSSKIIEALLDDGFIKMPPEEFDGEDRFVCAVCKDAQSNDLVWTKWRPKMVFSYSNEGLNSEIYDWQQLDFADEKIQLGILSEKKFVVPENWWQQYGADENDAKVFYKVVADLTYRFMVAEVIDETAEWCGHMSSVVVNFSKG